jgi:CRP-like cAMP-binding protein
VRQSTNQSLLINYAVDLMVLVLRKRTVKTRVTRAFDFKTQMKPGRISMPKTTQPNNQLLSALPAGIFQQLLPKLERFELVYDTNICVAGETIEHAYFPESGIISILAVVDKDSTLEVGIVGSEGMVGIPLFLGIRTADNRAVVQGAGFALRMTAADFIEESERGGELVVILKRFTFSLMTQIGQSAACNRYHPIDARLARWLLMTRDRMKSDEFRITQEFLSNMIGVRREAVNKAASDFQHRGLIRYTRGLVAILESNELKGLACSCYEIILKHDTTKNI